ncbi:MAG: peptidoglycan DD-metalloendopeptidase family protein [Nitrospirota bacterium]|nr:peptidoglycan DD-metalloendopeptidase family protein [Nitrospirota bacterium]MDH5768600.1 peptidoglycan DD-metalloendopeptidase family protein [Nitrospirota bacterium]
MRKAVMAVILLGIAFLIIRTNLIITDKPEQSPCPDKDYREICGTITRGETLFDIFKRYSLDIKELFYLKEASANIHKLRELYPGRPYKIIVDENNKINSFTYWINEDSILNIKRNESGFCAEKKDVEYERRIKHIGGTIKDNLILSMGEGKENLMLALQLSDIFAWDIDFTTDLRNGDTFKIVVEGFYLDGEFKKYGEILSAEFLNNGEIYYAYRFEYDGKVDYYDAEGKLLKKAFLKAPLNFRRISSGFTGKRLHPILKIYRPHHGLDYAAPSGAPVSAIGDGTVTFAGYKGQYGKLVVIKHPNNYKTYYGHLSKIEKGITKGIKVTQGQIIGYVGTTGLSTGPHLHYEIRINNKAVNPLAVKMTRGTSIPKPLIARFIRLKSEMNAQLALIIPPVFAFAGENKNSRLQ